MDIIRIPACEIISPVMVWQLAFERASYDSRLPPPSPYLTVEDHYRLIVTALCGDDAAAAAPYLAYWTEHCAWSDEE